MPLVEFLTKFLQSRFRLVLITGLLALLALAVLGCTHVWVESDIDKMLRTPDPVLEEFESRFPITDDDLYVILKSEADLLQPSVVTAIRQIHNELNSIEGITETRSLLSLRSKRKARRYLFPLLKDDSTQADQWPAARAAILAHPLAVGHLISQDRKATVIATRIDPLLDDEAQIRPLIERMQAVVTKHLPGHEHEIDSIITGFPALHAEMSQLLKRDQRTFTTCGILIGAIIGYWLFRSLTALVIVGAGPVIGALMTLGLAGATNIPITVMNTIMPVIVIVVGYADSVHLMLDIRHQLTLEPPPRAIALSIRKLWLPCLLTSLTTAIGFGSLSISTVGAVREFGMLTAFGCLVNFFMVQLVVAIFSSYFPQQIQATSIDNAAHQEKFHTFCSQLATFVDRRPKRLAIGGLLSTLVFGLLCFSLRSQNRLADSLPAESTAIQSYAVMERQFGGASSVYFVLDWVPPLRINSPEVLDKLAVVQEILANEPQLGQPLSLLDMLQSLPGKTGRSERYREQFAALQQVPAEYLTPFLNTQYRQATIATRTTDIGADAVLKIVQRVEKQLAAIQDNHPGVTVTVTGPAISLSRSFIKLIRDLGWSLLLATCLIFLLMSFLFRSLSLGLASTLPNAFALLGAGASLVLTNTPLQFVSVLCFTVCLGISVDDTIHFLMRYQWHRKHGFANRPAVLESIREVGPALMVTTCVFVAGYAVTLLSYIPSMQTFGWLSALSLSLAVIADVLFLPAVVLWLMKEESN